MTCELSRPFPEKSISVLNLNNKNNLPTTLSLYAWLIFGSVLTWHSYTPLSRVCDEVTFSIHSSEPSACNDWKRWSFVYVRMPTVKMCKSRFRIQETWKKSKNMLSRLRSVRSCIRICFLISHIGGYQYAFVRPQVGKFSHL